MSFMAVVALLGLAVVCAFFLYVLVQFWREEKHPRRSNEPPAGFPMVSSGQIVIPLEPPRGERREDSANQKKQDESENRR
jgi:hypothetical protein